MQSGKANYRSKYVKKGEQGNEGEQESPKRQRAPRFAYPNDWKEEIEKTVTADSKIPVYPHDDELLVRPEFDGLRSDQNTIQKKIEKCYNQMQKLKDEQKQIRDDERNKNNSGFTELKAKQNARKELSDQLKANKEQKEKIQKDLEKIDDKMSKLSKKALNGKILPKQKLDDLIRQKEEEFKNSKHTAAEESKWIDEINELKKNLPLMNENEALRKERDLAQDKLSHVKKESKVLFDKIQALSGTINEMRDKLGFSKGDEQNEGRKGDNYKKKDNNENKEDADKNAEKANKPQRELTENERSLKEQRDKLFEEVNKLKEKKEELSKKFDQDNYDYEKQQFEIRKIDKMVKLQKKLKYDENKKKRAEEDEKYRTQEAEKAKELLQFKYSKEIDICDSLTQILNKYNPSNKTDETEAQQNVDAEYKIDDKMLKEENLVLMKPKKVSQNEGIQPGQKKTQKKNKPKKAGDDKEKEDGRILLDIATLQTFNDIKVMPPTNVAQIESVISQLNEKKAYYQKLREDEMEKAFAPKTGDNAQTNEEGEDRRKEKRENKEDRQNGRQDEKPKKQAKVEMNDEDFPSLS